MRRFSSTFAFLLLLPAAAAAQPADTSFRAFYSTLADLSDAGLKATVEGRQPLHAAFASLELHKRTNNQAHVFRAARILGQLVSKDEQQPWAHLGIAQVLVRIPRTIAILRSMGVAAEGDGEEPIMIEVHTQLQLALRLDPALDEARAMLAEFSEVPTSVVPSAPVYTDGAAYFAALDQADEAALEKLVRDVAVIASPQEILTVTQGDFDKRVAALRLFWKKRSVRDGVSAPARVVEHYRRIHFARDRFGPPVPYYTVFGKKRVGLEAEMDDRGLIYVRYGAPHNIDFVSDEITLARKRHSGSEVWAYQQPDGRYHAYIFIDGRMEADPMRWINRSQNVAQAAEAARLLTILQKYDGRYHFIAMRQGNVRLHQFMAKANPEYAMAARLRAAEATEDAQRQNDRIVEKNRRMLFAAFDMDAARPRFPRPLTLYHDFATFRGRGCTDVVYSVAVPASSYSLSLAVADTFTWEAQTIDTTVTGAVAPGDYLRATGVFCSRPDHNGYVRLTATADSTTGATAGGELRIPDYSGSGLLMSDILVARAAPGPFVRGQASLSLVPPRQFREGESFRVFYELYNLPAGRSYRTEITLTTTEVNFFSRLFRGRTSTKVTFEGTTEGRDVMQELRTLVPQVEAGEAELTVRVTDLVTGETASNRKTIWIVPK